MTKIRETWLDTHDNILVSRTRTRSFENEEKLFENSYIFEILPHLPSKARPDLLESFESIVDQK